MSKMFRILRYAFLGGDSEGHGGLSYALFDSFFLNSLQPLREYQNNLKRYIQFQRLRDFRKLMDMV